MSCPLCRHAGVTKVFRRNRVPTHQHLLISSPAAARRQGLGTLDISYCRKCGLVFNSAFQRKKMQYGPNYESDSPGSVAASKHLKDTVDWLRKRLTSPISQVLEIGCGQGRFLQRFVQASPGLTGHGIDPSFRGSTLQVNGRVRFSRTDFTKSGQRFSPDLVICRHLIEHIASPVSFLDRIHEQLKSSRSGYLFLEMPSLEWILKHRAFWDFFYEHFAYFTETALRNLLLASGFRVVAIRKACDGQFFQVLASRKDQPVQATVFIKPKLSAFPTLKRFAREQQKLIVQWRKKIRRMAAQGRVAVWGAGPKGVTFIQQVDPKGRMIACLVDINPKKQGGYSAVTAHPICHYRELKRRGVERVVIVNRNYRDEIYDTLKENSIKAKLFFL